MRVLVVKTSSLGDIIQAFSVLEYLKSRSAVVDWAVEARFADIVRAHPLVGRTIALDLKGEGGAWRRAQAGFRALRAFCYDLVIDLQGNVKSGFVTLFARGRRKVGFGRRSVREWPNLMATREQFEVAPHLNIRLQYLSLVQQALGETEPFEPRGVRLQCPEPVVLPRERIMVCPGSKWPNKQLSAQTWRELLQRIEGSFLFVWGSEEERALCQSLCQDFAARSALSGRLTVPAWQNLMGEMDLILAVDSSALHLAATTATPTFSLFGPTSAAIFQPLGAHHFAYQGRCPYGQTFVKLCPRLRTCPTGACMKEMNGEAIWRAYLAWRASSSFSKSMCPSTT